MYVLLKCKLSLYECFYREYCDKLSEKFLYCITDLPKSLDCYGEGIFAAETTTAMLKVQGKGTKAIRAAFYNKFFLSTVKN